MALIKCRECGHDVSENAFSCPYCGSPIAYVYKNQEFTSSPKNDTLYTLGKIAIILFCIFIGGLIVFATLIISSMNSLFSLFGL